MATKKKDLIRMFDRGKAEGHAYMIVVTDTYSFDIFPVYCSELDFSEKYGEVVEGPLSRAEEVYNLRAGRKKQMDSPRAFNPPMGFIKPKT